MHKQRQRKPAYKKLPAAIIDDRIVRVISSFWISLGYPLGNYSPLGGLVSLDHKQDRLLRVDVVLRSKTAFFLLYGVGKKGSGTMTQQILSRLPLLLQ